MANKEHIRILRQGVDAWNRWREKNLKVRPDLSDANLNGVEFYGADLSEANLRAARFSDANLSHANLNYANLNYANLVGVNLSKASLNRANLSYANLCEANLTAGQLSRATLKHVNLSHAICSQVNLTEADLSYANLSKINLIGSNLTDSDLTEANLNNAECSHTNLSGVNLTTSRAVGANFEGAILTDACIQDWHITSDTNLNNIVCEHIYLRQNQQERRPSDSNKTFAPGEFTKLFQKAISTVDLIFRNGVDWQALLFSLEKLRVEAEGEELTIQAIENKYDGDFVVRVNTPPGADKAEVEKFLKREYDVALKVLDQKYHVQLQAKDREIEIYRQQSTDFMEIARLLANRPINVEATATAESQAMAERNINTGGGSYYETISTGGGSYIQGNYINMSQDLTDAASKIQSLLTQLQNQGETSELAQRKVAEDLAKQAKEDPTTLDKLTKWGKKLGDETVTDVVKSVVKLALQLAGVPLP